MGNTSFLYYKVENAEAITISGQLVNMWTSGRTNDFINQLFGTTKNNRAYGDTDSCYFNLSEFAKQTFNDNMTIDDKVDLIDQFSQEIIEPFIHQTTVDLADYMNAMQNRMKWGREVIAQSAIFSTKKRYIMNVNDSEGVRYKEPKMKIKGLEAIRSDTPQWAKTFLKKCYLVCLEGTKEDFFKVMDECEQEFYTMNPLDLAKASGISNMEKWEDDSEDGFKKGTPYHVKAAILYNQLLSRYGIINEQPIRSGDKIKLLRLKKRNPLGRDYIAFDRRLPKEFGLEEYIDRDTIFEKNFKNKISGIIELMGWTMEEVVELF